MGKRKKEPYVFQPSTKEVFLCLSSSPKWLKLLLDNSKGKDYEVFLASLIQKQFLEEERNKNRLTIKLISEHSEI